MGIMQEFKEFAVKGNVVDMGVGIVIGAAFTSIVNSFVNDIVMPVVGFVTGGIDFSNLFFNLGDGDYATLAAAQEAGAATINYGMFINAVITFLIVAWIMFMIIKGVNQMKREAPAAEEAPAEPPAQEVLLGEIRDLLAKN